MVTYINLNIIKVQLLTSVVVQGLYLPAGKQESSVMISSRCKPISIKQLTYTCMATEVALFSGSAKMLYIVYNWQSFMWWSSSSLMSKAMHGSCEMCIHYGKTHPCWTKITNLNSWDDSFPGSYILRIYCQWRKMSDYKRSIQTPRRENIKINLDSTTCSPKFSGVFSQNKLIRN